MNIKTISNNMYKYSIYKLINPITQVVFYVGITNQELKKRLGCHISESISTKHDLMSNKHLIIYHLVSVGSQPIIELIEEINGDTNDIALKSALAGEEHWINHYNDSGIILANKSTESQKEFNRQIKLPVDEFEIKLSKYLNEYKISKKELYETFLLQRVVAIFDNKILPFKDVPNIEYERNMEYLGTTIDVIEKIYNHITSKSECLNREKDALGIISECEYSRTKQTEIFNKLIQLEEIRVIIDKYLIIKPNILKNFKSA